MRANKRQREHAEAETSVIFSDKWFAYEVLMIFIVRSAADQQEKEVFFSGKGAFFL